MTTKSLRLRAASFLADTVLSTIPMDSPYSFGRFISLAVSFVGTPGKSDCHGRSVSVLTRQYGGMDKTTAALGYSSVQALQTAIQSYCDRT